MPSIRPPLLKYTMLLLRYTVFASLYLRLFKLSFVLRKVRASRAVYIKLGTLGVMGGTDRAARLVFPYNPAPLLFCCKGVTVQELLHPQLNKFFAAHTDEFSALIPPYYSFIGKRNKINGEARGRRR